MENDITGEPMRSEGTPTTKVSPADIPPGTLREDRAWRHRRQHVPVVGPLLLILAGSVFLLNNLGFLPWDVWGQVWRLWPLIPIAIGLDIILGRRSPALALIVVLGVIAAGVGILYNNGDFASGVEIGPTSLNVPLDGAERASVRLDFGAGDLSLSSLPESAGQLATGILEHYGNSRQPEIETDREGDTLQLAVQQKSEGFGSWLSGNRRRASWNIRLNPAVPLDLDVNAGASNVDIDLAGLQVSSLNLDIGASDTTVVFPAKGPSTDVQIDAGAASVRMVIPEGVATRINVSSAASSVNIPNARFTKNGDSYQTAGYDTAERKLTIGLDAGAANISVETP